MIPHKYLIVDSYDGTTMFTDSDEVAQDYISTDDHTVVNLETGMECIGEEWQPIKVVTESPLQELDGEDDDPTTD